MKLYLFALCISFTLIFNYAFSATISSAQSGDWNTASTWSCSCVPSSGDDITIEHDVTLNASTSVNSLTFGEEFHPTPDIGTLVISTNSTLTVATGTTNLNRNSNSLIIDEGSSLVKMAGNFIISAQATASINGTMDVQSGNFTVSGGSNVNLSVGVNGDLNVSGTFNFAHDNRTININGTMTVATMTANGGGGSTFVVASGAVFTITNALTVSVTQNYTVSGLLNIGSINVTGGSPDFNVLAGGQVVVSGDVNLASSAELTINSSGTMSVGGSVDISGGATAEIEGALDVTNDFTTTNPLTGSGTVTVGGTVTCPGSGCGTTTLPVELVYFKGVLEGSVASLAWRTASEIDNDYFTLEMSIDGEDYQEIATVKGNATTNAAHDYSYEVYLDAIEQVYFRLKQTDFDGTFVYTGTTVLTSTSTGLLDVYPNPVQSGKRLIVKGNVVSWGIYDVNGVLRTSGFGNGVNTDLPAGIYIIKLTNAILSQDHRLVIQ